MQAWQGIQEAHACPELASNRPPVGGAFIMRQMMCGLPMTNAVSTCSNVYAGSMAEVWDHQVCRRVQPAISLGFSVFKGLQRAHLC